VLEAHAKIHLRDPVDFTLPLLEDMCALWGMRLLRSGSKSRDAEIAIPTDVFKRLFKVPATKGSHQVPPVADIFIESIEVKKVAPMDGESRKGEKK